MVPVEIVPLDRNEQVAEFQRMIARAIEEQVNEALLGRGAILQPFFGSRAVSDEIKRRQTVPEQHKFSRYFETWGCMRCDTKLARHDSCGMCGTCRSLIVGRLREIVSKALVPDPSQPTFMDGVRLARAALAPPITALAQASPTSVERAYRTQDDAAREAGIHPKTLSLWICSGKVQGPAKRISGKGMWEDEDIERLRTFILQKKPKKPARCTYPGFRTHTEAAQEAGITRNTLYLWVRSGKVQRPETQISPTKWLWSDEDIKRLKGFVLQKKLAPPAKPSYRNQKQAAEEAGIGEDTLSIWISSGKFERPAKKLSAARCVWTDEDVERLKAFKAAHPWKRRDSR